MPVLLKHGGRNVTHSSSSHFPRADSNLSRQSSRPTLASASSKLTNAGSHLLNEVRRRSRTRPSIQLSERLKNPKEWLRWLKHFYRRYHLKHLLPLFIVMIYMCVGALIFYWLESGAEDDRVQQRKREYEHEMEMFIKRLDEIALDRAALRNPVRKRFVREAVSYFHNQLQIKPFIEPEWSITTAMYFSGTIFTTIGFGDVNCKTVMGRIATVVYAIVGIPIMLITLNDLGKFLYKTISDVLAAYDRRLSWFRKLIHKDEPAKVDLNAMEGGNLIHELTVPTEEPSHHVSFNLRPASEELTLDMEANEDPENARLASEERTNSSLARRRSVETAENSIDGAVDYVPEAEAMEEEEHQQRMPVLVAVGITVGWIFVCAGLFKLWEDWTYAESCYFMFISLSTIGLGDLSVKRRDLMVVCFIFVIIGLSLVSMCISVIQAAIEDLYKRMLMKLLEDYQAKLASGDHKGASMGMMRMWGNSKTAKYLMPMLSADKRRTVMAQIQEEAKDNGIELPPIFEDLDEKTGMPKILAIAQEAAAQHKEIEPSIVESIVRQTDPTRISMRSRITGINVVYYDSSAQTDTVLYDEKNDQTVEVVTDDLAVQTDTESERQLSDDGVQTDTTTLSSEETQTQIVENKDNETMTASNAYESAERTVQTEIIATAEQQLQTRIEDLIDFIEGDTQTPIIETKNERIQTPYPETTTAEVQTELTELGELRGPSTLSQARRKIKKVFQRTKTAAESTEPEMSDWKDVSGGSDEESSFQHRSSPESLDWDPIDGMHAEKQRPVQDLKKMFDKLREAKPKPSTSASVRKPSTSTARKRSGFK